MRGAIAGSSLGDMSLYHGQQGFYQGMTPPTGTPETSSVSQSSNGPTSPSQQRNRISRTGSHDGHMHSPVMTHVGAPHPLQSSLDSTAVAQDSAPHPLQSSLEIASGAVSG